MIGVDVNPCQGPPGGVRRMVEGWMAGFAAASNASSVRYLLGSRPALAREARSAHVTVFVSPYQAFPRLDVPVVVTVHELPFVRCGPIEGRVRAAVHRYWLRRNAREAAAIVVPSIATRDDVLSLHPRTRDRVHVVPHGFDPLPWRKAAESRKGPASEDRAYVLAVGATSRRKGLDVLADAKALVTDLRVVVVGTPPRDVDRRLRAAGIEVRRRVDDQELVRLVAGAHLFVHPARSEGFGFPPLEAMAAGVPVVATTGGSMPEICGDAAVLVPPGDADALADAMRRVRDDTTLRSRLIAAGRLRADAFPILPSFMRLLDVVGAAENPR